MDLLSSQPLCFDLFGPLAEDLGLATAALQYLRPDIRRVNDIRFEWSPGRGDIRYTGNRSAFDVFIDYLGDRGRSFLGIEVKYHEDLTDVAASDPDSRYPDIAQQHKVFRDGALPELQKLPLQQLWLDHLLALQLGTCPDDDWDAGTFALLHPVGNTACAAAAQRYRLALTNTDTYDVRTLDDVVQADRLACPLQAFGCSTKSYTASSHGSADAPPSGVGPGSRRSKPTSNSAFVPNTTSLSRYCAPSWNRWVISGS